LLQGQAVPPEVKVLEITIGSKILRAAEVIAGKEPDLTLISLWENMTPLGLVTLNPAQVEALRDFLNRRLEKIAEKKIKVVVRRALTSYGNKPWCAILEHEGSVYAGGVYPARRVEGETPDDVIKNFREAYEDFFKGTLEFEVQS
jgi:hypothetical protein